MEHVKLRWEESRLPMKDLRLQLTWLLLSGIAGGVIACAQTPAAPVQFATPSPQTPLFFREEWRQTGPFDASSGFRPQHPITAKAVTNPEQSR
jgi:hypothetical protein